MRIASGFALQSTEIFILQKFVRWKRSNISHDALVDVFFSPPYCIFQFFVIQTCESCTIGNIGSLFWLYVSVPKVYTTTLIPLMSIAHNEQNALIQFAYTHSKRRYTDANIRSLDPISFRLSLVCFFVVVVVFFVESNHNSDFTWKKERAKINHSQRRKPTTRKNTNKFNSFRHVDFEWEFLR